MRPPLHAPTPVPTSSRLVLAIFLLSGAAGLIYEVVWARQLVLVFGNTTQAVSAILTGFFGGMAIGSAFGGRLADRVRRPLRLYGAIELVLVVIVLITPITFRLLHEVYRAAFGTLEATPFALALVRFGLALLALAPATVLMGATLPTLTRYLTRGAADLTAAFGKLYAANTIGAIVGTALSGFVLIEILGLSGTLAFGAACSGAAGLLALGLDRRSVALTARESGLVRLSENTASPDPPASPELDMGTRTSRFRLALAIAFVSGLTSLAYQVLWMRLVASGTGNLTYIFTMILATFLTGIALGAMAFNIIRQRIPQTVAVLAVTQVATAILVLGGMVVLDAHFGESGSFAAFLQKTILVVLPTTFVIGISFPASAALLAGPAHQSGSRSGLLLAVNTIGAIVGTFVVPFLVIPAVGSATALGLVALANAATGVALALAGGVESRLWRKSTATAGAALLVVVSVALLSGSLFVDPSISRIKTVGGTIFRSAEDEIASVQAGSLGESKQLWVTGTSMTALTVDARLMLVLPLMLRPAATSNLTIAFGMGSAYREAIRAGLITDAVDIVPSVPLMFGQFYPDAAAIFAQPQGHVIIADGRNHVELTARTYDMVVVDPPPPIQSSGVSVISSHEFYQATKARLTPGGVMMQWVPFGQTIDEFKAHVRTFRDVFPNVIVANGPGGNGFFMLGSDAAIGFDPVAIRAVLSRPGIVDDLSSAYDSPKHAQDDWAALIPTLVRLEGSQVAAFAGPGPLITDDRPLPEYFVLRQRFGPPSPALTLEEVAP